MYLKVKPTSADKCNVGLDRLAIISSSVSQITNRYYRNDAYDDEDGCSYTLTFTVNFPHDNDTVYMAHCYPYTYR